MTSTTASENNIPVTNPRTGEIDFYINRPCTQEVNEHCQGLRSSQKAWGALSIAERSGVLLKWAEKIHLNKDKIIKAEAEDTGRWRIPSESPDTVVWGIKGWCERAEGVIEQALNVGKSSTMPHIKLSQQLVPYPLVGVISPWNFPLMLSTIDAIPALLAGAAVIIKPSEITPRFIEPIQETIEAVPELKSVLSYVAGDGKTGQEIIANADIICFTGSVPTGRKVAEACAKKFIPCFLELGGKDPVIVTSSADISRAADAVLRGSVFASGQICYSIERVYVEDSIHDQFVDELVEKTNKIKTNSENIHTGHIGPLIFHKQADIIDSQINDAVSKGAKIMAGGTSKEIGGGKYIDPTILINTNHNMAIMQDETFGPVMPIMKFSTPEEAIDLANDTTFGLSASVIAGDEAEAAKIGTQINAGGISLMDTTLTGSILRDAEKTSFNLSGLGGSRMGDASIMRFLRKKALMTNPEEPVQMSNLSET